MRAPSNRCSSSPALGCAHQVTLVEQQQQVLVARVLLQVLLQVAAPGAVGVARVQHLTIEGWGTEQHTSAGWQKCVFCVSWGMSAGRWGRVHPAPVGPGKCVAVGREIGMQACRATIKTNIAVLVRSLCSQFALAAVLPQTATAVASALLLAAPLLQVCASSSPTDVCMLPRAHTPG